MCESLLYVTFYFFSLPLQYSTSLNKIFVDREHVVPVDFTHQLEDLKNIIIRALLVYTSDQHKGWPVNRCPHHEFLEKQKGVVVYLYILYVRTYIRIPNLYFSRRHMRVFKLW